MKIKFKKFEIHVDLIVVVAIFFCIIPAIRKYLENYFSCYLFIAFHELSHMVVANLFGIKTSLLHITLCGVNIVLEDKPKINLKWFLIFAIGPVSNIMLGLLFKRIPLILYINLALGIINLFPFKPLDGYNLLEILLDMFKIKRVDCIIEITQKTTFVIMAILGGLQFVILRNPSILFMILYIYIQAAKHSNKENFNIYQKYYKNITEI